MDLTRRVAIIGSREFKNYAQLSAFAVDYLKYDDELVSGGAIGADGFGQRYAKEHGHYIDILYPNYGRFGKGAPFTRNGDIALRADTILAFYSTDRYQIGGTRDTVEKALKLGKNVIELKEENIVT